jgi:isopentenyl-diphosphate Delta-isomerase
MEKLEHESLEAADSRKQSHLDLAFKSQSASLDDRFHYEPMMSGHPTEGDKMTQKFGSKTMDFPIWISSMTGGTSKAGPINKMLAKTAAKFGFGMALGSCRIILEDDTYLEDFNLRPILGDSVPFYANVGIAQVERILNDNKGALLKNLVNKLSADGLIIHINPLQEWLQPEGDKILQSPVVTIQQVLNEVEFPIIVKEVGQGFGPKSMGELLKMPLMAIEFAANGGTNFAKLELIRNEKLQDFFGDVIALGHSADEMVTFLNDAVEKLGHARKCNNVIISGGVKNFLDGYYYINKAEIDAVYGQAAPFLKYANESQEALDEYAKFQINGLLMSQRLLRVK